VGWRLILGAALAVSVGSAARAQRAAIEEGRLEAPKAAAEPFSLRDGFESPGVAWRREHTDAAINLIAHDRSDRAAYEGTLSERFLFESEPGSAFYFSYPVPDVPVTDLLNVSLQVRANRAGIRLFVRVVLPKDVDPETRAPSFLLVPGTIFDRVDRWQRLEVVHLPPSLEEQARVLRVSSRRPVSLEGAYVDSVVVNLMGGQGGAEVFLDDLTLTPVPAEVAAAWSPPGAADPDAPPAHEAGSAATPPPIVDAGPRDRHDAIRLDRNRLSRAGDDQRRHLWVPIAVEAPGADVTELRRYGFDMLVDEHDADPARLQEAVDRGFRLMPRLSRGGADDGADDRLAEVRDFPFAAATAFWMVDRDLGRNREIKVRDAELARTRDLIRAIHGLPPDASRLTIGEVRGDLPLYARSPLNLDAIAIPTNHWAAAQDPKEFHRFLLQRRELTARANMGQMFWAMIPAAAPPALRAAIWGDAPPPAWGVPRPLPEHLRAMTYMALAAGYRGLIFQGDADLTRPAGRPLLIESSFLNMEIDLVEGLLAQGVDPIATFDVFDPWPSDLPPPGSAPSTKVRLVPEYLPKPFHGAAAIKVQGRGTLLLLSDYSNSIQYQPYQMAARDLVIQSTLTQGTEAFEIGPGGVEVLSHRRVPGGTFIDVPEFDTTAMILCTSDMALKDRVEAAILRARPTAVQLAIEQAETMIQQIADLNGRLAADGIVITQAEDVEQRRALGLTSPFNDAAGLLAQAEASVKSARDARDREDFALAWKEARRAQRPLRILAFSHWGNGYQALVKATLAHFDPAGVDLKPGAPRPAGAPEVPGLLLKPTACPPLVTYATLPELYVWLDWIRGETGYRFGPNRVPSGTFDDAEAMKADGWMDMSYQADRVNPKMAVVPPDYPVPSSLAGNRVIRLNASPVNAAELETILPPFVDHPLAAVRSPAVKVRANNLVRVSVVVRRPMASAPGAGGLIVRDSIGGEQLQFRSTDLINNWSRVVLYRKAPTDVEFTVTLGLAGYGEAWFDDFRVELIEGGAIESPEDEDAPDVEPPAENIARDEATEPAAPDAPRESVVPRLPATTAEAPTRRPSPPR
jgi:hypothetical protein